MTVCNQIAASELSPAPAGDDRAKAVTVCNQATARPREPLSGVDADRNAGN